MVEQAYEHVEMQKPSIWQRHVYRPYTLRVAESGIPHNPNQGGRRDHKRFENFTVSKLQIQRLIENMDVYKPTADGSGILDGFCQHG